MENQNNSINISGGTINANNLAIGKNATIKILDNYKSNKSMDCKQDMLDFKNYLKELIADNKIESAINEMITHFKKINNKEAINLVILKMSSYNQLQMQVISGILSHDEIKIDIAKINYAIIELIDREIKST